MANDTEAPTNQATIDGASGKGLLTEQELSFVTLLDQHWSINGTLMTADYAKQQYEINEKLFATLMSTKLVRDALAERGVVFERFDISENSGWISKALTPIQLIVANTMLDVVDTRSNKKKLQDLNVSTLKYQAWLRDPVFREYLDMRSRNLLGDNGHEAYLALMDKVSSGDIKALEFYFEITGKYTRKVNSGAASNFDFGALLVRILEIIIDEVDDPETAFRITDRLKSLGTATNTAFAMTEADNSIIMPSVAAAPKLDEDLQAMVDSGASHSG